MQGLLDFLKTPAGQGVLAAGLGAAATAGRRGSGPLNALGQGGLMGLSAYTGAQEDGVRRQFMDAQMTNMQSEAEARKFKMDQAKRDQELINSIFAPPPSAPGQMGSGSFGVVPPPQGQPSIPQSQSRVGSLSPDQLAMLKLRNMDLTEVYKLTQPDMQVSNGYAFDKRRVQPGFLPQLSTSQDGKTSMVQIGPDGLPVVSAPRGALETFAGYQNVQEGTKANYDPVTVTPQGENPQMTTRGALVRNPRISGRVSPAEQAGRDSERNMILASELEKAKGQLNAALSAGDQSAAARAQADIAALQREMGGRSASIGLPLQSEEEKLRATKGVEADAERNKALTTSATNSRDTLSHIGEARRLLRQGPTSSGVGAAADAVGGFFGKSTKGADVAAQLDTLSGWMVANVPRMEGPQSNFDVQNYRTMAALVGDRTKPLSQRLKALDTLETLQQKYAHLNGGTDNFTGNGATGSWSENKPAPPTPMKGMVRNGYRFKGGDPADKSNWEKQ